ncbi:unnamed protein product [Thelazia callipaeda]|uniref:Tudor domain-containing protein n=1 Tax=Thelazia callipaeda TaxID=103827 RepID=A0A0N5D8S7_THECL|nr:unnamed protein product [Thelazia callipaeda]
MIDNLLQLTLPEGERFQVICSSVIDVDHFFLQQPQHPSFSALRRLDCYMLGVYMQPAGVPDLPKPIDGWRNFMLFDSIHKLQLITDKLCVAPAYDGWYRAVTVDYYPEEDEVLMKYVDYGGYSRLPRSDLRQIRTDFMSLPFQATECRLAHVLPVDGSTTWCDEAMELFLSLIQDRIVECYVIGYHINDSKPFVELFTTDSNNRVERVDNALLNANLAKAWDPSKVRPVLPRPVPVIPTPVGNEEAFVAD